MNVLQINPCPYLPFISGTGIVSYNFAKALKAAGHEVTVTSFIRDGIEKDPMSAMSKLNKSETYEYDGVDVVTFNSSMTHPSYYLSLIMQRDIDVVVVHNAAFSLPVLNISLDEHKTVWVLHQYSAKEIPTYQAFFDVIMVIQKDHYDEYIEKFPHLKEKFVYSPWLIDEEIFYDRGEERANNSVLFAGRVVEHKGPHTLLQFLNQHNLNYTIVGPWNNQYRTEFLRQVVELGVQHRIDLKDPIYDRNEFAEEMNRHRFLYLASEHEGCPVVIGEALACGMEPLILDLDKTMGLYEGIIPLYNSVEEIGEEVGRKVNEPRKSYSKEILDLYSMKAIGEQFVDILDKAIRRKR